ncbi:hypothetical protein ZWY2020_040495 [Hordeum vulgare]|nr:hypothetical protein ZWY2020_040495 [Hordeum vulgare]
MTASSASYPAGALSRCPATSAPPGNHHGTEHLACATSPQLATCRRPSRNHGTPHDLLAADTPPLARTRRRHGRAGLDTLRPVPSPTRSRTQQFLPCDNMDILLTTWARDPLEEANQDEESLPRGGTRA